MDNSDGTYCENMNCTINVILSKFLKNLNFKIFSFCKKFKM